MAVIHFLNVLEGDCNIIEHDSGRLTVIDVSNADNHVDTDAEKKKKESAEWKAMHERNDVGGKVDYGQKKIPDNPIDYIKTKLKRDSIFRFIITHPDMDHLDGIKDLYEEFNVENTWDTDNNKPISDESEHFGGYNREDWEFYENLRAGKSAGTNRLTYFDHQSAEYWAGDHIKILAPSPELLKKANYGGNFNDSSYVLLFTPPKANGGHWKILFAGDSDVDTWEHIMAKYKEEVRGIDILFAPHHGRDSGRDFEFVKTLNPTLTLFGNASSKHLAYSKYPKTRITNNQAGFVVLNVTKTDIEIYVKNKPFANHFRAKQGFSDTTYNSNFEAYFFGAINA